MSKPTPPKSGPSRLPRSAAGGPILPHDVIENAAVPTFFVDQTGTIIYANRAFGDLLGYSPAECVGLGARELIHSDDASTALSQVDSVVNKAISGYKAERKYIKKTGEIVWVLASASVTRGPAGEFLYMSVQAVDIDRQKRAEGAMSEIERRWNFALESAGQGVWDYDRRHGREFYSRTWKEMRGLDPEDAASDSTGAWLDRVHPDDHTRIEAALGEQETGEPGFRTVEYRERHADGHYAWILRRGRAVEWYGDGRPARIIGTDTDITVLKTAEHKLQFANNLLTTAMEISPDGLLVVDADAKIISFNRRFADMWGVPVDALAAGDDAPVLAAVTSSMRDPEAFIARVKYLYQHPEEGSHDELETKDGRWIDRHTGVLRVGEGDYLGRVWFFRDITERKHTEAQMRQMARSDALTGLANRAVFMEAIERAIAVAQSGGPGFAAIYLDLDHFKDVNDTLGHPVGDEFLKAVAGRLRANIRSGDLVARFGGDEFAVLMTDVDSADDAAFMADKLIEAMSEPFLVAGNDIRSGASIGISLFGADAPDSETMLSRADLALYRAKSEGRSGFRFFTDAMDTEVRARVSLGSELREAIATGQLFLMYQAQVDLATGRITGVEALVRWRHPMLGVLGPGTFIPLAERTGLIAPLGQWVLREACLQARAWLDAGIAPDIVAVNLSAVQFKRAAELERGIAATLDESGVPASRLELELTETVLMSASSDHNDVLQRLRASGVRLAIDDFGVGYSSLDYLRRFPVDRIKIAQAFTQQIVTESGSAAIVRATIGLARELGIKVIAEGIETARQLALLAEWGCREGQGYYFARPLSVGDLTPLLADGHVALNGLRKLA